MLQAGTDTTLEACRQADTKIRAAGQALLASDPGAIDFCQSELQQAVTVLERLVSAGAFQSDSSVSWTLLGIRRSAQVLKVQIEYASTLHSGWIQLRFGAGYTEKGLPLLITGEASGELGRRSFEG
jgi:hypothetical protein